MIAQLRTSTPEAFFAHEPDGEWITDPVLIDSALQLAVVWARTKLDQTPLPARIGRYRRFAPAAGDSILCEARIQHHPGNPILAEIFSSAMRRAASSPQSTTWKEPVAARSIGSLSRMLKRRPSTVNDNFPTPQPSSSRGVAIIGLACVFPKARTLEEFWWNIVNKVDAVTDAPPERLDLETGYDPNPNAQGKVYCKKGGWIGESFAFNPAKYGIMPSQITGSEPDQFLMLRTVYEAMEDAGYLDRKFDGTRVSVTIGKGNFTGPGQMTLTNRTLAIDEIANIVRGLEPELSKEEMDKIRRIVSAPLPPMTPDLATGIIPNVLAGRVSNRMDLMGRNLTVDAACASSLIAVEVAVAELLSGISDMAIVGGIHTSAFFPLMCVFASMRASSLTSTIRPYDQEADGTILGEGAGVLVLKRLEDAERDRDRIYAVIRGVGSSSDGKAKSVVAPAWKARNWPCAAPIKWPAFRLRPWN